MILLFLTLFSVSWDDMMFHKMMMWNLKREKMSCNLSAIKDRNPPRHLYRITGRGNVVGKHVSHSSLVTLYLLVESRDDIHRCAGIGWRGKGLLERFTGGSLSYFSLLGPRCRNLRTSSHWPTHQHHHWHNHPLTVTSRSALFSFSLLFILLIDLK